MLAVLQRFAWRTSSTLGNSTAFFVDGRCWLHSYGGRVAFADFATLPWSNFEPLVMRYRTRTSDAFSGLPLSQIEPSVRGEVLARCVREVHEELYPLSSFRDPMHGTCANGARRGAKQAPYDWLRDKTRVECKSAQLSWLKSRECWNVRFRHVKYGVAGTFYQAEFDELLLVLYSPRGIYVYTHDARLGMSTQGKRTSSMGHAITIVGPSGEWDADKALTALLGKLDIDTNSCNRIAYLALDDERVVAAIALHTSSLEGDPYKCSPLSETNSKTRGDILEAVVRAIDSELHPSARFSRQLGIDHDSFGGKCDWIRDGCRIECKSAKLAWSDHHKGWRLQFKDVKIASERIRAQSAFDELLLALYCPQGIYVYRHDGILGLSTQGKRTSATGHVIQLSGPRGETCWLGAMSSVLAKLDARSNDCKRLAFVSF